MILTRLQRELLVKVYTSATPTVAFEIANSNQNNRANKDILIRLGILEERDGEVIVTENGEQIARDEDLIDDEGGVSPLGQEYVEETILYKLTTLIAQRS